MEPAREAPWAEHEKVYLLAEIVKSSLPSHVLLGIIREYNIQPQWNDIALPHGRSLRSCQMAYDHMNSTIPTDYRQRPQLPAPIVYPGPDLSKKRPHQPEAPPPSMGRLIQPRPPHSYPGEYIPGPTYALSPVGEPVNKKKRGRPTKAESQARAEAAAARGEVYPPPRKGRQSLTSADPPPGEAQRSAQDPSVPTPSATTGAATPQQTQPEQPSADSSSGKRKRAAKPTPLELEKPHREVTGTESPLAYAIGTGDQSRGQAYSTFTPISAPLPSGDSRDRDRDVRMEGVEETQPRTTTPHSFKDTVGI